MAEVAHEKGGGYKMKLMTTNRVQAGKAASLLRKWGCCVRCIIRYLGCTQVETYRRSVEALLEEIESLISDATEIKEAETEPSTNSKCACPTCLGILEEPIDKELIKKVADKVNEENHERDDFFISIKIPVSILLREHAVWLLLRAQCKDMYYGHDLDNQAAIKEVWKWVHSPTLETLIGVKFSMKSNFDVCIAFSHENVERECRFLMDIFPSVFRRRKCNRSGWETFTRVNVSKAIKDLSEDKFKRNFQCPPNPTYLRCQCQNIECTHEAIFMAGRYNKYCRALPQSPWILDGERKAESSIQELICDPIMETVRAGDSRFSASGREDVDVRMLGTGRPFVVEIINPHRLRLTHQELAQLQKKINTSTTRIKVQDLQFVTRDDTLVLKEGEENKIKCYSALCTSDKDLTQEDLDKLKDMKDVVLDQITPIRVLHRRAIASRERTVHSMKAELLDPQHFQLYLQTQAGTYVKEFVHGDFGRTKPCVGSLLNTECDIVELDVDAVHLDWPPSIDYSDVDLKENEDESTTLDVP